MTDNNSDGTIELLTFQLAGHEYALDIMSVREIRSWTRATPLPHAPTCMRGVINLRGTVLPVLDLGDRLGLLPQVQSERAVIIVVTQGESLTGLLVDAVSDIVALTKDDLQPPPDLANGAATGMVSALTLIEERMVRVLNLAATVTLDGGLAA